MNHLSNQTRATNLENDTMDNRLEEVNSKKKKEDLTCYVNTAVYPSFYLLAK